MFNVFEIIATLIIIALAVFIIIKSLFNSKDGKCNCGCDKCNSRKKCVKKDND